MLRALILPILKTEKSARHCSSPGLLWSFPAGNAVFDQNMLKKTAKPCRKHCFWLIVASFFAPIMIATYGDSQQVLEENFKPKTTSH
jgi:hypothetical protein